MEHVTLDVAEGVATVTLDRPEMRNALTSGVATDLIDAIEAVPDEARCVVLAGNGPTFCAGGDIDAMVEGLEGERSEPSERSSGEQRDPRDGAVPAHERVERIVEETAGAVRAVATCNLPTVAKIHGPAYGAGGALAVACDLLLASESASISFGFRQVGLNVDSGASHLLPRIVGENVAKELLYTGELIDADRAEEVGLFNHVYADEAFEGRVAGMVDRIASGPTVALKQSKRLVEQGPTSSFDEAVRNEAAAQIVSASTDDHEEGVRAFVASREPEFEGE
ncbi:enoyl-CoA hydratase/isomerase family protein [Halosimplex litoreum]|uniref:Enoyl-CoA hydratase/isomerase family protein n=1 Tax=Halosimplex litoreum TaxID=1198301 RepID=A0A7T3FXG1_9EURY|nr:enoyl-CoA hydratase-related protein [Halosimplex litoreum]QPV62441.1 enoyl-CoA hydratase/isomerase family protein [Halosimplex litoreum]